MLGNHDSVILMVFFVVIILSNFTYSYTYKFFLRTSIILILLESMPWADAWDNYLKIAPTIEKAGRSTGLPGGVEKIREFRNSHVSYDQWNKADLENLHMFLEESSALMYQAANPGTPFIGVVNLYTGMIYLHPSVLTYAVTLVDQQFIDYYNKNHITIVDKNIHKQFPENWKKIFPIGSKIIFTPQKYTVTQLPRSLFNQIGLFESFDPIAMNSDKVLSAYGGLSILNLARHKGSDDDRYKKFVYHSRNDAFVMQKERDLIYNECHPDNQKLISSHECLVAMLGEQGIPHVGFAITKHDENFCMADENERIGEINGLYFTGTSASQNRDVYNEEALGSREQFGGNMGEREARKIYNAVVAGVGINPDAIRPCPGTFEIERNLPGKAIIPEHGKLHLIFKIMALGQARDNLMEHGYQCQWYKNGIEIDAGNKCEYIIPDYSEEYTGLYSVKANPKDDSVNVFNSTVAHVTLAEKAPPPSFKVEPPSIIHADPGKDIALTFEISNASTYKWEYYDIKPNPPLWRGRGTNRELNIMGFDPHRQGGRYRFTATNNAGSVSREFIIESR